jgi:hypothetical protein
MASRRYDRDTGSTIGRKLIAYAVVILLIIWAARNPHQAEIVLHALGSALANWTAHAAHSRQQRS